METLTFYLIKSKDGKYLRSRGMNGGGEHWVTDIKKAKVYTKKGTALSQITWWSNNFPKFGVPDLIPLVATPGEPIAQEDRVKESQRKKEIEETKRKLWSAQRKYDESLRELERSKTNSIEDRVEKNKLEIEGLEVWIKQLSKK
jgi:hypothetical protein